MKKLSTLFIILIGVSWLSSCNHTGGNSDTQHFKIDSSIISVAKVNLRYYRPNNPKSSVRTKVSYEFYINNKLDPTDSDTLHEYVGAKNYWLSDTYYEEDKPIDTLRANMKFYFRAKFDKF